MKTKTPEEVAKYIKVFKKRIDEFPNGDKIMAKINKLENEKIKNNENQAIIDEYFNLLIENEENDFCDIFSKINLSYKEQKGKKGNNNYINYNYQLFNEEEDKYLLCLLIKYGYRNWNPIKFHILTDPFMKFNINMKMKTDQELIDRANYIINLVKNEIKKIKEKKELIKKEQEKKQKNAMRAKLRNKSNKNKNNNKNGKNKKNEKVEEENEENYEDEEYEEEIKEKKKKKPNNKSKSKSKKKVNNKKKKKKGKNRK